MKNSAVGSYSTSLVHLPAKKKLFHNVSARKRIPPNRSLKPAFEGRKVTKNVHANINFSELDEVCLDVGKVDLSFSARIRSDNGLSPPKIPREKINEFHEVSFRSVNGHADSYSVHNNINNNNNRKNLEKMKTIRSCYVQLESLGRQQKTSMGVTPRVPVKGFGDGKDGEWKGWQSNISFSEEHSCPKVVVVEDAKISEVLIMSDDLVDSECLMLEKRNGRILNHKRFGTSIHGSCDNENGNKSCEKKNDELKEKLYEFFANTGELNCFLESVDVSFNTLQNKGSQKESCNRKLSFCVGNSAVPNCSSGRVQKIWKGRPKVKNSRKGSSGEKFLGYSESAILSSKIYAKKFLDFYEKVKCQNEML